MAVTKYLLLKHWQQSQNVKPNRSRRRFGTMGFHGPPRLSSCLRLIQMMSLEIAR